jgi:hypothetical protein
MLRFKWVLSAALLSAVAMTPNLWTTARAFPTVPALLWLPDLPQWLSHALSALLVSSVAIVAVLPNPGLLAALPAACAAALVLFDVNRLQPWLYQYMLIFAALALMEWRDPDSRRSRSSWAICGFVLIATYLWSGLQKANLTFAVHVFPWLLQPLGGDWAGRLQRCWVAAPVVETSVGVLLFFPRTRAWGLAGAAGMHASILLALGPLGQNVNSIVWPWNIWMPIAACILFNRNDADIVRPAWSTAPGKVAVILVGVMPALSFVDRWDGPLSASLYSGRLRDGWIYLTEEGASRLPESYTTRNEAFALDAPGRFRIDVTRWAESTLNVPPYAEPRVYRGIMRRLEAAGVPRREMTLLVRDRTSILDSRRTYSAVPIR